MHSAHLSFLEKIIELVMKKRLTVHTEKLNVLLGVPVSMNFILLKQLCDIVSDLLEYTDEGKCAILILLDLSDRLLTENFMYTGVEDMALDWFKSYLEN